MTVATWREARAGTGLARLVAVLPLAVLFIALASVYVWQGRKLASPWTFYDELYYTQLARSFAGDESLNFELTGEPRIGTELYSLLTAPAWLLDDAGSAYAAVKLIGAIAMTAALFPIYALARTVVSRRLAFFAAAGTAAAPALSYSSAVMEESLAYPLAALCFLLMVNAVATRGRFWIAAAVAACSAAPFLRPELFVLPVALVLAAGLHVATSDEGRRRWARARHASRLGAFGAVAALTGVAAYAVSRVSAEWSQAVESPGIALDHILRAGGALAVGIAFLPAVAGLAWLGPSAWLVSDARRRAFSCVFAASLVGFLAYTGLKAGYLAAFGDENPVSERTLIYLVPLLLVAAALWLERRPARVLPVVAAGALVGAAVLSIPLRFPPYPASDAPSFAVIDTAHDWGWSNGAIRAALVAAVAASALFLLVLPRLARRAGPDRVVIAAACAAVLAWTFTAELDASAAGAQYAKETTASLPRPFDWVDRSTGGEPAVYLGQQVTQDREIMSLAFWNRSIVGLFTLDQPPHGVFVRVVPGVTGEFPIETDARYILADSGIKPLGRPIAQGGPWVLYAVRPPIRIASAAVGVYSDGWMGRDASYWQFAGGRPGTARVTLSRELWCRPYPDATVTVTARSPETVLVRRTRLGPCDRRTVSMPATPPFQLDVHVGNTFVPGRRIPDSPDTRRLGAQPEFSFAPGR